MERSHNFGRTDFCNCRVGSGPNEGHYGPHRYIVSSYVLRSSSLVDALYYYLDDRYMTTHAYDPDANDDILASEKQEILARLNRVKTDRTKKTP